MVWPHDRETLFNLGLSCIGRERTGWESHDPSKVLSSVTRQLCIRPHFLKMLFPSDRAMGMYPNHLPQKPLGKFQVQSIIFCLFFIPKGLCLTSSWKCYSVHSSELPNLNHSRTALQYKPTTYWETQLQAPVKTTEQNKTKKTKKKSSSFQDTWTDSLFQKK